MDRQIWLKRNRAAIAKRLQWLQDQPQGLLFSQQSGLDVVIVQKVDSQLRLRLFRPGSRLVQSRLDLTDPLHLVSPYSQAAMLGLVWKPEPHRIYIAGFGGGRLPLVLHHYLPQVRLEATETDPVIIEVAAEFFGVQPDARLVVANQDGRNYLAQQKPDPAYDLIFNDAFSSQTGPFHLATQEFYELCRSRLAGDGAVITNLLRQDSLYAEKLKTIRTVFAHLYLWSAGQGNQIVIGSDACRLNQAQLVARAQALQAKHRFSFSLVDRAQQVEIDPPVYKGLIDYEQIAILVDS